MKSAIKIEIVCRLAKVQTTDLAPVVGRQTTSKSGKIFAFASRSLTTDYQIFLWTTRLSNHVFLLTTRMFGVISSILPLIIFSQISITHVLCTIANCCMSQSCSDAMYKKFTSSTSANMTVTQWSQWWRQAWGDYRDVRINQMLSSIIVSMAWSSYICMHSNDSMTEVR